MCAFSCPSSVIIFLLFLLWDHMGQWFCYIRFYFSTLIFGHFSLFGVTFKCWLLIGWKNNVFFAWFSGWSSSGYAYTIGTLRGSALVVGFFSVPFLFGFLPSSFLGVSFGLPPWLLLSEVLLGGGAFLNISARVFNSSLFSFPNFTKGLVGYGLYSA